MLYLVKSENYFLCRLPFQFVSKSADGVCAPCCYYISGKEEKKDFQLKGNVEVGFNSSTFKDICKKMLRKKYVAGCRRCYDEEEAGSKSYGRVMSEYFTKHFQTDTTIKGLDIALSRECNLACRMCGSDYSTKWDEISRKLDRKIPHYYNINLDNIISKEETYHSVTHWKIVGGEPFIGKTFYNFLEKIKDLDLSKKILEISTNCTVFPKSKYLEILLKAKRISLGISIDGIGKLGEYIRVYSKWNQVNKTAKLWNEFAAKHPSLRIHTQITVSIYNIHDLYSIFKWAKDRNIVFKFHILYGPSYLRCWILPENLRKKIYDYYLQFPDFYNNLLKLKKFLFQKQEGNIKDFLNFNDKMDQICGQDFFEVNSFYSRKDLEEAI